jgi:hypothetical protein
MGSSSQFKGVGYSKDRGKWFAKIYFEGLRIWLGYFDDEAEAARAYDHKAVELFGEFAYVNFPEEWPPKLRREVYANYQAALKKERKKTRRKGTERATCSAKKKAKGRKAGRKTTPARAVTPELPRNRRKRATP